jgi:hypothetical protein
MADYRSMVAVMLTAEEADEADDAAARIVTRANRAKRRDAWGEVARERQLQSHKVGARGERAFAKWRRTSGSTK